VDSSSKNNMCVHSKEMEKKCVDFSISLSILLGEKIWIQNKPLHIYRV